MLHFFLVLNSENEHSSSSSLQRHSIPFYIKKYIQKVGSSMKILKNLFYTFFLYQFKILHNTEELTQRNKKLAKNTCKNGLFLQSLFNNWLKLYNTVKLQKLFQKQNQTLSFYSSYITEPRFYKFSVICSVETWRK